MKGKAYNVSILKTNTDFNRKNTNFCLRYTKQSLLCVTLCYFVRNCYLKPISIATK